MLASQMILDILCYCYVFTVDELTVAITFFALFWALQMMSWQKQVKMFVFQMLSQTAQSRMKFEFLEFLFWKSLCHRLSFVSCAEIY